MVCALTCVYLIYAKLWQTATTAMGVEKYKERKIPSSKADAGKATKK